MKRPFVLTLFAGLGLLLGCEARIDHYRPNGVYSLAVARQTSASPEAALADVTAVTETLFGTPDEPRWPAEWLGQPQLQRLVDPQNLARAAGPVSSDRDGTNFGLYRKHCVTCHGISGSGAGPAALVQNPYPRDFRHGVFKWKSTERAAKPTRDDLRELLDRGVPGTAMPSFALLPAEDREALIDYVVYLAVRGEVERRLIAAAMIEFGYDQRRPREIDLQLAGLTAGEAGGNQGEAADATREIVQRVAGDWLTAEEAVVPVPEAELEPLRGERLAASIDRGRAIFHAQVANCVGCHGPAGNGMAVTVDYDDWSKEYSTRLGLTPEDREAMRPFREAGALPPRRTEPRRLSDGVFRGGGGDETLYRRISEGIAGTPMPELEITESGSGLGLSQQQTWDLVRYVKSLASEGGG